jgi:predicted DNA-binding transcriptional regulator AlpA
MKRPTSKAGTHGGDRRRKSELEATFARFLAMSYADQLDFCGRLQTYLPLSKAVGPLLNEEFEKRLDSLECLRQVRAHLGIDSGPTVPQYREASRELELPWSGQQIQRLWGRWWEATNALDSGAPPRSAAARSYGSAQVGRKRSREEWLHAVRLWLATGPSRDRGVDYDDWAREHNASAEGDAMPRRSSVVAALGLPWREVLAIAREERTHEEVHIQKLEKRDWSRGPHRLVSLRTVALMRGSSVSSAMYESKKFSFPLAAATFRGRRTWLLEEVESYCRGDEIERQPEDRLRYLYLDVHEYADMVGLSVSFAQVGRDVAPIGMAGSTRYWLRQAVEQWVADNRYKVEARKARRKRTGTAHQVRESDFVSSGALKARLGISQYAFTKLTGERGFPKPVITVGDKRVWLLSQVEAYLAGNPLPPTPTSALEAKLVDAGALGDLLALKRGTAYPSRTQLPPPLLTVGRRQLWCADEVEAWVAGLPEGERARINRRRQKRGLAAL